jgi:hypothetical protein
MRATLVQLRAKRPGVALAKSFRAQLRVRSPLRKDNA